MPRLIGSCFWNTLRSRCFHNAGSGTMRAMRPLLLSLIVLAGCAEAGRIEFGGRPDGSILVIDSPVTQHPDGTMPPPIDAPPGVMMKTLTQTTSGTLVQNTAPACGNSTATDVNDYYRVFDLTAAGITTDFHVTQVSFQVDYSTGQSPSVKIGTYSATPGTTLNVNNMATVTTKTATVPSTTTGATVNVDFTGTTITAGSKLLFEIDSPAGSILYMGANTGGESASGYIMAPACSINSPTDISTVSATYPTVDLLMTVTGTY
jgi:hypothetical protein